MCIIFFKNSMGSIEFVESHVDPPMLMDIVKNGLFGSMISWKKKKAKI